MVKNRKSRKTNFNDSVKIPDKITFRSKDLEIKNALRFQMEYRQIKSVSEVVRQCVLDSFKSLKVKEEKQKELNKIADLFDLKVVDKYSRG